MISFSAAPPAQSTVVRDPVIGDDGVMLGAPARAIEAYICISSPP
jgi:hypothetical protein